MRVYNLEDPVMIGGIPFVEFAIIVCLFIGLGILGVLVGFVLPVPHIFFFGDILLCVLLYLFLKKASVSKQPQFLASYLAFHIRHPRRIEMDVENVTFLQKRKGGEL